MMKRLGRERVLLEESLTKKRSDIMRMENAIKAEEQHLKDLEIVLEKEQNTLKNVLKERVKISEDARALSEKQRESKQEKKSAIEKLTEEIRTTESEVAELDETLNELKTYKDILCKLLPSFEWQKAMEVGGTNSQLDNDSSEEKLLRYLSDPQEVLDLRTKLTEQILSQAQHSRRGEETLKELQQTIETKTKKMNEDDEKLTLQVNNMIARVNAEKKRASQLKKMVQLHDSIKTKDQDSLLEGLCAKVSEVHGSDPKLNTLSTLQQLSSIEYQISSLMEQIESIPAEYVKTMRQIKVNERRSRRREEAQRLERERLEEKKKKYMERCLSESKKKASERKLVPRCFPVEQKIEVIDEDNIPAEDALHAYLFGTEDSN